MKISQDHIFILTNYLMEPSIVGFYQLSCGLGHAVFSSLSVKLLLMT